MNVVKQNAKFKMIVFLTAFLQSVSMANVLFHQIKAANKKATFKTFKKICVDYFLKLFLYVFRKNENFFSYKMTNNANS
uniref:Uncharacterized protein n=1 Tax=Panagrolaimus superbus TaxID=310955 RepID=A0A914YG16_9BILA